MHRRRGHQATTSSASRHGAAARHAGEGDAVRGGHRVALDLGLGRLERPGAWRIASTRSPGSVDGVQAMRSVRNAAREPAAAPPARSADSAPRTRPPAPGRRSRVRAVARPSRRRRSSTTSWHGSTAGGRRLARLRRRAGSARVEAQEPDAAPAARGVTYVRTLSSGKAPGPGGAGRNRGADVLHPERHDARATPGRRRCRAPARRDERPERVGRARANARTAGRASASG